jgi:catechol-2,3-dioxygenase
MLCAYEDAERRFIDGDGLKTSHQHGLNHFALRITDRKDWQRTVDRENIHVEYGGPVTWPHSKSWYVRDPTGYEIEVVSWGDDKPSFG